MIKVSALVFSSTLKFIMSSILLFSSFLLCPIPIIYLLFRFFFFHFLNFFVHFSTLSITSSKALCNSIGTFVYSIPKYSRLLRTTLLTSFGTVLINHQQYNLYGLHPYRLYLSF